MDAFDYAFNETLGLEGGYSNDPLDRGGETKYGITKTVFEKALDRGTISGIKSLSDLTTVHAKAIYKTNYWLPIKLHEIHHVMIAAELFDTAVNSGTRKAVILAQMALDYLGETVDIDGAMGPQTLGLLNKWCSKDPRALFVALNGFQFIHFVLIVDDKDLIDKLVKMVTSDDKQTRFSRGWTKRVQSYKEG